MMNAFGWFGGKYSHLGFLLPLLPRTHTYCEPFGGSGSVLLNRWPSPVETFNDLDSEVVNFFRVLRSQRDDLIEVLSLTPISREEYTVACEFDGSEDSLERARLFYMRAKQTWMALASRAIPGRWSYCRTDSNRGMSTVNSKWFGGIEGLAEVAQRLLRVQIEHRPAVKVIETMDSPDTLHYCDPPYPFETRTESRPAYAHEMDTDDHRELAEVLHSLEGKVAISGYRCDLMDDLYGDWAAMEAPPKPMRSTKGIRQEVLWRNYGQEVLATTQTQLGRFAISE